MVRRSCLDLIYKAQTSHIGSNLSCVELLSVLYNVAKLSGPERDKIILSKGWAAAAVYSLLHMKGILTQEQLDTYGQPGGLLGLVERSTPGIEASTGSMGHGLPIAVGMAIAAKKDRSSGYTYVVMSDGEMATGTTYESALLASHHKLSRLTVIVDYNGWQAMGKTNDVLNIEPLSDKWESWGWNVLSVDGHNTHLLEGALRLAQGSSKPTVIIARTIKGKGVSFMEDKLEWHYKNISKEEYELAIKEL